MLNSLKAATTRLVDRTVESGLRPSAPASIPVKVGLLDLLFEPESGFIRHIRMGEVEIIRAVYGAGRDRNWTTVPPVLTDVSVEQHGTEGFEISFTAECRAAKVHFVWRGNITGDARQGIRFRFDGAARRNLLRNRIGLCVLHPIAECAGKGCVIQHSDGKWTKGRFPLSVSPAQPLLDIRAIRHRVGPGALMEVRFDGEIFEMEDQRNWTDASFKTYGTPLALPFPVRVRRGEKVRQTVTLQLIQSRRSRSQHTATRTTDSGGNDIPLVRVDYSVLRKKPPIGFGFPHAEMPLTRLASKRLQAIRPDHLRVDCRLWRSDWPARLALADDHAMAIGAELHVAIFLASADDGPLRRLARMCRSLHAPVRLWFVFHRDERSTRPEWVRLARKILAPCALNSRFTAGTDSYFAELNRERPPANADWLPCCSINPQVHASDRLSLVENIAAQADVVNTARTFCAHPLVISPITLLPRFNPNATEVMSDDTEEPADPRQTSMFGAGWTLGSLSVLTSVRPIHSLTYFETIGPRGLLSGDRKAEMFPVCHVFAGIQELTRLARTQFPNPRAALQLAALAGVTESGHGTLWLANLTPDATHVKITTNPGVRFLVMRRLEERSAFLGAQCPQIRWRDIAVRTTRGWGSLIPTISMSAYGLARLEMKI